MRMFDKWVMGLIGLGALYLVMAHPDQFYRTAVGIRDIIRGTVTTIEEG